ncbi:MAG: hypothetical protein SGJ27_01620 [Candidatus Melainabacteria bacterium]|nr:hypothetical protein [Candidatus Melainabacteria bacterium]
MKQLLKGKLVKIDLVSVVLLTTGAFLIIASMKPIVDDAITRVANSRTEAGDRSAVIDYNNGYQQPYDITRTIQ